MRLMFPDFAYATAQIAKTQAGVASNIVRRLKPKMLINFQVHLRRRERHNTSSIRDIRTLMRHLSHVKITLDMWL